MIEAKPKKLLQYNYWSSFSGLADKAENYSVVSYVLEALAKDKIKLSWHQKGFANEAAQKHTESGLPTILEQIKELVEG